MKLSSAEEFSRECKNVVKCNFKLRKYIILKKTRTQTYQNKDYFEECKSMFPLSGLHYSVAMDYLMEMLYGATRRQTCE